MAATTGALARWIPPPRAVEAESRTIATSLNLHRARRWYRHCSCQPEPPPREAVVSR
jgi:hypothetical protein